MRTLPGYDNWLEAPYQRAAERAEELELAAEAMEHFQVDKCDDCPEDTYCQPCVEWWVDEY